MADSNYEGIKRGVVAIANQCFDMELPVRHTAEALAGLTGLHQVQYYNMRQAEFLVLIGSRGVFPIEVPNCIVAEAIVGSLGNHLLDQIYQTKLQGELPK